MEASQSTQSCLTLLPGAGHLSGFWGEAGAQACLRATSQAEPRFLVLRNKVMDTPSDTSSGSRSLDMENTATAVLKTPPDMLLWH